MSTFWPTAAAACCVARSPGRASSLRYGMPVAIAPDDTRMISQPRACACARASTSGAICPTLGPLIDDEPTLTTTRLAPGTSAWLRTLLTLVVALLHLEALVVGPDAGVALALELGPGLRLRVHPLEVGLATGLARGAHVEVESRVGTAVA